MNSIENNQSTDSKVRGDVLVLGAGVTGQAVLSFLLNKSFSEASSITLYAGKKTSNSDDDLKKYAEAGVKIVFDSESPSGSYDLCIASPGISEHSAFYKNAAKASSQIISEIELAYRYSNPECTWIAVSGTNGKTTTTSLITHILSNAGKKVACVGNIGSAAISAVAAGGADYYVCEVSSYQLASCMLFNPRVCVLTNITPDHLSWHGNIESYVAAKEKLFSNLDLGKAAKSSSAPIQNTAIIGIGSNLCFDVYKRVASNSATHKTIALSTLSYEKSQKMADADNFTFVKDETLFINDGGEIISLCPASELKIKGRHNIENALAAAFAAYSVGVDIASIIQSLKSFSPLEHRIEPCGTVDGHPCFNDSKATNSESTIAAIESFSNQASIFLLGGSDKGCALDDLAKRLLESKCRVVVFGEAADRFYDSLSKTKIDLYKATNLEAAFELALKIAKKDEAIVLSPACASFDEFNNFEHRGRFFKELVSSKSHSESCTTTNGLDDCREG